MADICDSHKSALAKTLIAKLNPIIREWANYFSSVVSKEIFSKIDELLWQRLGRWANRRHTNKSGIWVKEKYFSNTKEARNWVFNHIGEYVLSRYSDVQIIRHVKVKGYKSPYDGDWVYWSNRMGKHLGVRKEVTTLLKKQKGKCESCGPSFRLTDLIEVDHIVPRSEGGSNTFKEKLLLHPHCHDFKTAKDMKAVNH